MEHRLHVQTMRKFLAQSSMRRLIYLISIVLDFVLGLTSVFVSLLVWPALVASIFSGAICLITAKKYKRLKLVSARLGVNGDMRERLDDEAKVFSKSSLALSLFDILCSVVLVITIGLNIGVSLLTSVGSVALLVFLSTRLVHLKKIQTATKVVGIAHSTIQWRKGENVMKNKIADKAKKLFKFIFVSNPVTICCAFLAIGILVANGLTDGLIVNTLFGWIGEDGVYVFYGLLGALGLGGAGVAGLESNSEADKRKAETKCKKQEELERQMVERIACEKLAKEKAVEFEQQCAKEKAHYDEIVEQVRKELAEKAEVEKRLEQSTTSKTDILGYINSDNVYVLTNLEGHSKKCEVTPETTKTAYLQAKKCGAKGFVAITGRGRYGFDEMADQYYVLGSGEQWQGIA